MQSQATMKIAPHMYKRNSIFFRSGRIGLEFVLDVLAGDHGPDKIFFIETSGRDHLLSRQACAVEAAATQGQVRVVVVLSSNTLDLEANNATRQVYNNFKGNQCFRHQPNQKVIFDITLHFQYEQTNCVEVSKRKDV